MRAQYIQFFRRTGTYLVLLGVATWLYVIRQFSSFSNPQLYAEDGTWLVHAYNYHSLIPFFISDGLHSYQDIPVLLGIASESGAAASQADVFRNNPYDLYGKKLFYANAIGTEPLFAEIILDQVHAWNLSYI